MDQLSKTPAQISILEILCILPIHKDILDKALRESWIQQILMWTNFKLLLVVSLLPIIWLFLTKIWHPIFLCTMMPFTWKYFSTSTKYNESYIYGGVGLNICTLKLVKTLGYSKEVIDSTNKILIRDYDDVEQASKWTITLPIKVGPTIKDIVCQVLDL